MSDYELHKLTLKKIGRCEIVVVAVPESWNFNDLGDCNGQIEWMPRGGGTPDGRPVTEYDVRKQSGEWLVYDGSRLVNGFESEADAREEAQATEWKLVDTRQGPIWWKPPTAKELGFEDESSIVTYGKDDGTEAATTYEKVVENLYAWVRKLHNETITICVLEVRVIWNGGRLGHAHMGMIELEGGATAMELTMREVLREYPLVEEAWKEAMRILARIASDLPRRARQQIMLTELDAPHPDEAR